MWLGSRPPVQKRKRRAMPNAVEATWPGVIRQETASWTIPIPGRDALKDGPAGMLSYEASKKATEGSGGRTDRQTDEVRCTPT